MNSSKLSAFEKVLVFISQNPPQTHSMLLTNKKLRVGRASLTNQLKLLRDQGLIEVKYLHGQKVNYITDAGIIEAKIILGKKGESLDISQMITPPPKMLQYQEELHTLLGEPLVPERLLHNTILTLIEFDENGFPIPPFNPITRLALAYLVNRYNLTYYQPPEFWIKYTSPKSNLRLTQNAITEKLQWDDVGLRFYLREWCRLKQKDIHIDTEGNWWIVDDTTKKNIETNIHQNVQTLINHIILSKPSQSIIKSQISKTNLPEIDCIDQTWQYFTRFLEQRTPIRDNHLLHSLFRYFFSVVVSEFQANPLPQVFRLVHSEDIECDKIQICIPAKTFDRIKLEKIITPRDLGVVLTLYQTYQGFALKALLKTNGYNSLNDFRKTQKKLKMKEDDTLLFQIREQEKASEYAKFLTDTDENWTMCNISISLGDLKHIIQYLIPLLAVDLLPKFDQYVNLIQKIAIMENPSGPENLKIGRSFEAFALLTRTFELIEYLENDSHPIFLNN